VKAKQKPDRYVLLKIPSAKRKENKATIKVGCFKLFAQRIVKKLEGKNQAQCFKR